MDWDMETALTVLNVRASTPEPKVQDRIFGRGSNLPTQPRLGTIYPKQADAKLRPSLPEEDGWKLVKLVLGNEHHADRQGRSEDS